MKNESESRRGSQAGRELVSLRRKVRGVCPVCGTEFEGISTRKYCSSRCTLRAFRARQKDDHR